MYEKAARKMSVKLTTGEEGASKPLADVADNVSLQKHLFIYFCHSEHIYC